ncbi:MAG: TldD/PmbA family protein [Aquificae bacterium]|nr:TldD/PmbA family protein [Aquificota bacterium]
MEKVEEIVKRYIKAGYEYEVFVQRVKKNKVEVSGEEIESLSSSEERGLGLRVIREGRQGFSYTSSLSEYEIRDVVEKAMEMCELQEPDEGNRLVGSLLLPETESPYDEEGVRIPLPEKAEIPLLMERYAKELDGRIVGVRKSTLTESVYEVWSKNSFGVEYTYSGTAYTASISTLGTEKGDSAIAWEFRASRYLKDLDWRDLVEDAVFKTVNLLLPSSFQTRSMPVVFFRDSFAMLLEAFSPLFLGDYLVKGKTLLKDRVGDKVASDKVTLLDDGVMKKGFGTHPYDGEGVPQRKKYLIKEGVFEGFLHSLYTATKTGQEPTGNGMRSSYRELPQSGITNLYLKEGHASLEELLSGEEVFLVLEVMGLHTVDTVSGDFSLGVSGVLYRNGKKFSSVRGITVAGNIIELLKNVEEVGMDLKFYGNVGSPSVLVKKLTLGGS